MAKRRTKKQKEKAKHSFTVSWTPEAKNESSEANVKRQIKNKLPSSKVKSSASKNPNYSVTMLDLASIKKEMVKSVGMAAFIVGLEIMIYLFWRA